MHRPRGGESSLLHDGLLLDRVEETQPMGDWRDDRIGAAERGEYPMGIARLSSGFAVIGDTQVLPGYCLLLTSPRANHLSDLSFDRRQRFLFEMSLLGEAIETACRGRELRRINYEILGNTDAYLHAHVFPRYSWEPAERHGWPVFLYPPGRWTDDRYHFSEVRHGVLKHDIATALQNLMRRAGSPEWSLSERA